MKEFLSSASQETQKLLLRKKADWAQSSNDQRLMATVPDMLMASGDYDKAIRLMMANGWVEKVANTARKLDRSDANLLREIGQFLAKKNEFAMAASIFQRINDTRAIVQMHVDSEHWEDAFALVARHPALNADVYLPYARWLAERDRFDEAQIAYNKAGHQKEAAKVLEQLTENAVKENRFKAASFYYRRRAEQLSEAIKSGDVGEVAAKSLKFAQRWHSLADIYFAYEPVFRYVMEPFTDKSLDTLFHAARFLTLHSPAEFVSRTIVLYTLMRLGRQFGNFKTARQVLEQLRMLKVPPHYQAQIDVATLEIRAMPFSDSEEFQPLCYSCGTRNPILGSHACVHCSHPFVYSFLTFEVLPLVQFHTAENIKADEAIQLINMEPPPSTEASTSSFIVSELSMNKQKKKRQMKLDREQLLSLDSNEVFLDTRPSLMGGTCFFLKVIKEIKIAKCPNCQKFFNSDDFQMAVLQLGQCPVCQAKVNTAITNDNE